MSPQRIQRKRTAGWRMPEGAVYVGRPSKWGNPYIVHTHTDQCSADESSCPVWGSPEGYREYRESHVEAVTVFRHLFQYPMIGDPSYPSEDEIRDHLAGHDLACWCPLDAPCHADVLLQIANAGRPCRHRWDVGVAPVGVGHECFREALHKGGHVCPCGAVRPAPADLPVPLGNPRSET